jgi:hypothetical protein
MFSKPNYSGQPDPATQKKAAKALVKQINREAEHYRELARANGGNVCSHKYKASGLEEGCESS